VRRIAGRLGVALTSVVVLASCNSTADMIVVNRTTLALALFPGVTVPACGKGQFTGEQMQAGVERDFDQVFEDEWIPEGAVAYSLPTVSRRVDDNIPIIILVTSAGAEVGGLVVPGVDPCEGEPLVVE
jgi:hypothetical protein